jgi:type II secretory pathway component GspD/PulD (secretin)
MVAPPVHAADDVSTQVVMLQKMPVSRAALIYRKVIGVGSDTRIEISKKQRMLVVRDRKSRLTRFTALIVLLDKDGAAELRIFVRPVLHVEPTALAKQLKQVMKTVSRAPLTIVPDPRSRKLVVMTTRTAYKKLDILARRIDVRPRKR